MLKKLSIGVAVAAAALIGAMSAQAASLSIVGGYDDTVSHNFSLSGTTGLTADSALNSGDGSAIKVFDSANDGGGTGLFLAGAPTDVTFEYLGSDAGLHNRAVEYEGTNTSLFKNWGGSESSVGDSATIGFVNNGALAFLFRTAGGTCAEGYCARNAGQIGADLSIALFQESATSIIAMFGDGWGDGDIDDLAMRISVTAVPLPPSVLLFGGALLGLGWISRKRKMKQTA